MINPFVGMTASAIAAFNPELARGVLVSGFGLANILS